MDASKSAGPERFSTGGRAARRLGALLTLAAFAIGCPPFAVQTVHVVPNLVPPDWNGQAFQTYWMVDDEAIAIDWKYMVGLTENSNTRVCDFCQLQQCFSSNPDISAFHAVVNVNQTAYDFGAGCTTGPVRWQTTGDTLLGIAGFISRSDNGQEVARDNAPTSFDIRVVPAGGTRRTTPRELGADIDPTGGFDFPFQVGPGANGVGFAENFSNRIFVRSVHAVTLGPGGRIGNEHRMRSVRFGPRRCFGDLAAPAAAGIDLQTCRASIGGPPGRAERATPSHWSGDPTTRTQWIVNFDPAGGFPEPVLAAGERLGIVFELQAEGVFVPPIAPPSHARRVCLEGCADRFQECMDSRMNGRPTPEQCADGRNVCRSQCPAQ